MKAFCAVMYVTIFCAMIGCNVHSGGDVKSQSSHYGQSENWTARVQAASAISSTDTRDQAYAALALDAAKDNRPDIVKQCLGGITSNDSADLAAYGAAVQLAIVHNAKAAMEVAWAIRNTDLRDKALKEVASTN